MKNVFLFSFCVLAGTSLFAQTNNANNLIRDVDGRLSTGTYMTSSFDSRYEGIKGSPFFISEWIKGQLAFVDGRIFKEVPIKYNAYSKELLMKRPGGDSIIVFPYQISSFVINDPVTKANFEFKRYPAAQTPKYDLREVYFLTLYEGKTSLVKLVSKALKKADFKDPYSNNVRFDTYEDANEYYLIKADGSMVKVKKNKKSVLGALSDKEEALKALFEHEKLEMKTERELVIAVAKYNAI
ncbi:hypothetical protein [Runella sp.]|uniref:hypothetical protein n=1 Tax=Runella sp. TaxID=1960881 RepID=UPI003D0E677C